LAPCISSCNLQPALILSGGSCHSLLLRRCGPFYEMPKNLKFSAASRVKEIFHPTISVNLVNFAAISAESSLDVAVPELLRHGQVIFGMTRKPPISKNIAVDVRRDAPSRVPQGQIRHQREDSLVAQPMPASIYEQC